MPPTAEQFRYALQSLLNEAERMGFAAVEVRATALHRRVGAYPGPDQNMRACCKAMIEEMGAADTIRSDSERDKTASLVVRYALPRGNVTENVS